MAVVTNNHKPGGLQQEFIISRFWRPEIRNQCDQTEIKVSAGPYFFCSCGEKPSLPSSIFWWLPAFPGGWPSLCLHVHITSCASVSLRVNLQSLSIPLTRVSVQGPAGDSPGKVLPLKILNHIFCLLRNKTQLTKCEGLTGFIKRFMNWTVSHLASRGALRSCAQRKAFIGRRVGKEVLSRRKDKTEQKKENKRKERIVLGQNIFFG